MTSRVIPVSPFVLVVFGATGDLSQRKLLPALYHRDQAGQLPPEARIVGASRRHLSDEDFRALARKALEEHVPARDIEPGALERFLARLSYVAVDATGKDGWDALARAAGFTHLTTFERPSRAVLAICRRDDFDPGTGA